MPLKNKNRKELIGEINLLQKRISVIERLGSGNKLAEGGLRKNNIPKDVLDAITDGIIFLSRDLKILWANKAAQEQTGYSIEEMIGRYCYSVTHNLEKPCQSPNSTCPVDELIKTGNSVTVSHTHVNREGDDVFVEVSVHPVKNEKGEIVQFVHLNRDITEHKRVLSLLQESEAALRNSQKDIQKLAGRLIYAQEEELRSLARELHDDLTQRLAVLAIDAGKIVLDLTRKPEACLSISDKISRMKEELIKVSEDVHAISRQLHPAILDDLGLVRAIESECATIMKMENIEIIFSKEDIPVEISKDIALCFYRVLQESLKNVVKHSSSKSCEIFLKGADDNLCLTVSDYGIGFEPAEVRHKPGLGLSSMRERVQLINGNFSIESGPGTGAIVTVCATLIGGDV